MRLIQRQTIYSSTHSLGEKSSHYRECLTYSIHRERRLFVLHEPLSLTVHGRLLTGTHSGNASSVLLPRTTPTKARSKAMTLESPEGRRLIFKNESNKNINRMRLSLRWVSRIKLILTPRILLSYSISVCKLNMANLRDHQGRRKLLADGSRFDRIWEWHNKTEIGFHSHTISDTPTKVPDESEKIRWESWYCLSRKK